MTPTSYVQRSSFLRKMWEVFSRTVVDAFSAPLRFVFFRSLILSLSVMLGLVLVLGAPFLALFVYVLGLGFWFWFGMFGSIVLLLGLLPVASAALCSTFLADSAVELIEYHRYPLSTAIRPRHMWDSLRGGLGFLFVSLGWNALLLPLYGLLHILTFSLGVEEATLPLQVALFLSVNGWVLGREFLAVVCSRRLSSKQIAQVCKQHRFFIWFFGLLLSILMMVPPVTFFVPALGSIIFTHFFHIFRVREAAS